MSEKATATVKMLYGMIYGMLLVVLMLIVIDTFGIWIWAILTVLSIYIGFRLKFGFLAWALTTVVVVCMWGFACNIENSDFKKQAMKELSTLVTGAYEKVKPHLIHE